MIQWIFPPEIEQELSERVFDAQEVYANELILASLRKHERVFIAHDWGHEQRVRATFLGILDLRIKQCPQ